MDLLLEIARSVRAAVLPHLGSHAHRGAAGTAPGGDVTFGIDEVAEDVADKILEEAAAATSGLAWYTEDRGFVVRGKPTRLVVLDPIDGTRPAGAGLESCCVSVASAPFSTDATLGDVDEGVVLELKTGALYRARRGRGVLIVDSGETRAPSPSPMTSLEGAFWVYGLRGRPTMPSAIVLEELIDNSGVSGGTFDLGSASYAMCGVATGRFDAYVDHGQRLIDDIPSTKPLFEEIAQGAILNNSPYDVAASLLVCTEAGCTVTDAGGQPLEGRALVGSGDGFTLSTLAACTPELHAELLAHLDRGIERLRRSEVARGA
jgi:myo-inositol-1(or 4)-monophosphatase